MKENILDIIGNIKDKTDELVSWGFEKYTLYSCKVDEYLDNEYEYKVNDSCVDEIDFEEENKEIYDFESNRLREYLIKQFWMLPTLLEKYSISQEDIDLVVDDIQKQQNGINGTDKMDSLKMSIVFNEIYSNYSNKTLMDIGIVDHKGLPKINPVAFCYSENKSYSNGRATDVEILEAFDKIEPVLVDDDVKILKINKLLEKFSKVNSPDELYLKKYQDTLIIYFKLKIDIEEIKNVDTMNQNKYFKYLDNESIHEVFKYFIEHRENKSQG